MRKYSLSLSFHIKPQRVMASFIETQKESKGEAYTQPDATKTSLDFIAARRDSTAIALRWLPPCRGSSLEDWSYAKLWSTAAMASNRMPSIASQGRDDGVPMRSSTLENEKLPSVHSMRCVGLMVDEGPALAILNLAILISGYVLVPLSSKDPPTRLLSICIDCNFAFVIVKNEGDASRLSAAIDTREKPSSLKKFPILLAESLLLEPSLESPPPSKHAYIQRFSLKLPLPTITSGSVSHIFFTSGSTGQPKGCILTHGALLAFCRAKNSAHAVDGSSVVFVASPHTFDPSFGDLIATWVAGGTVACAPQADTFAALGTCLSRSKATHCTTTPALFETIVVSEGKKADGEKESLPLLKVVALGGEAMSNRLASKWAPPRLQKLANTYGTTECCVYQTFHSVTQPNSDLDCRRLGAPYEGTELIFAAEPGDDPINDLVEPESGELAELWIKGPQVGIGYLNRPAETRERFQFHGGCWMFRTGDVVKCCEGGAVLVGRRDSQVKLNGQRIELGEVEAGILRAAGGGLLMAAAAVVVTTSASKGRVDNFASLKREKVKRIVVWCVLSDAATKDLCRDSLPAQAEPAEDSETIQSRKRPEIILPALVHDVLRWLALQELPRHMIPARLGFLPSLPLTRTGKVARRPLTRRLMPTPPQRDSSANEGEPEFDRSDWLYEAVARIWSKVLGVVVESPNAHFAELGGDSLAALRVCQELTILARPCCNGDDAIQSPSTSFAGEAMGSMGPLELMKRQRLSDYVKFLRFAVPELQDALGAESLAASSPNLGSGRSRSRLEESVSSKLFQPHDVRDEGISNGIGLLYSSARTGNAILVKRLTEAGVPVEGWLESGLQSSKNTNDAVTTLTPLHIACANGRVAAAEALLEAGASLSTKARHGATPLILAAGSKHEGGSAATASLVQMLLSSGASLVSLDHSRQSALHAAARVGASTKVLQALIEGFNHELLHAKSKTSKIMLKRMGPILEWKDAWGRTPLHWASVNGHRNVVSALLSHGASELIDVRDNAGETARDAAERRALCSAKERPDGASSSVWGDIAKLLGGSGTTRHLKQKLKNESIQDGSKSRRKKR